MPGADVLLTCAENPHRATAYDLIAVYKDGNLFHIDSQIPNKVFEEWLQKGNLYPSLSLLRPETRYHSARFDFYAESGKKRIFIEVKGVTLLEDGVALFPDAPTERGLKHIRELIACREEGFDAWLVFVLQMKGAVQFSPNRRTQPAFADALVQARQAGVQLLALDCLVSETQIVIDQKIKIVL